jgi:hypothetical protein
MEYWPDGLRRAGGLDALHALIAEHYSHVIDLNTRQAGPPRLLPAGDLPRIETEYGWTKPGEHVDPATDLILSRDVDDDWTPGA